MMGLWTVGRRILCNRSLPSLLANRPRIQLTTIFPLVSKPLSSSAVLHKKSGHKSGASASPSTTSGTANDDSLFDLGRVSASLATTQEKLEAKLATINPSGRVTSEILETIRVPLPSNNNNSRKGNLTPLRELAQVVSRGRNVLIVVGDKEHVKPVTSAIQSSNLSLNPQPASPTNALELQVQIPAATAETRKEARMRAKKALDASSTEVSSARKAERDRLKKLEAVKKARPDDLFRAREELEKLVKAKGEALQKSLDAWERKG
ncbi:MAG: hypothetical protein M1825_000654 [Sarcosagium campestre]|nr:MAG: hypothetical protein M1825_000654 [Sarcosagium campestre]